jgi:DNA polymerase (family 10)
MSYTNQQIATKLREVSQLMQLAGENRFKVIAFDRAAQTIESLNEEIGTYIQNKNLTDIKGVGKSIAEDIYALEETGEMPVLQSFRQKVPEGLVKWLDISGLGPKNAYKIHNELGISTIEELKEKIEDGSVASLSGLGQKSAQKNYEIH